MARRVAVTGAAGRVGRGVLELFRSRGIAVVALDYVEPADMSEDDQVVWSQVDMGDYDKVVGAFDGCDALVHLAAIPRPGTLADARVHANNVVASYNALRAAVEVGISHMCQASSVNAIGGVWSRTPQYDYFPIDEDHGSYVEDPYSLSKYICEQQAGSVARRYASVAISSLRFHLVVPKRAQAVAAYSGEEDVAVKNLWGYVSLAACAGACSLALERAEPGHEVFQIVAPDHVGDLPSMELAEKYYPRVPLRRSLTGCEGFFDCSKAARLLGWHHPEW